MKVFGSRDGAILSLDVACGTVILDLLELWR